MYFSIPDDVLTGDHALFSPSASKRWLTCPASIQRSMGRENVSTKPAQIGTAAHWVLEHALSFDMDALDFIGCVAPNGIDIDDEMCSHVQAAIDWVRSQLEPGSELIVESRVDIYEALEIENHLSEDDSEEERYLPVIYGTVDIQIIHPDGSLTIADYKHGVWGISVKRNTQLELYAIGAIHHLGYVPEKVNLVILQPRNGGIKALQTTGDGITSNELMYWYAVNRALLTDAPAIPTTDACNFCLAKHECAENWEMRNRDLLELAKEFSE